MSSHILLALVSEVSRLRSTETQTWTSPLHFRSGQHPLLLPVTNLFPDTISCPVALHNIKKKNSIACLRANDTKNIQQYHWKSLWHHYVITNTYYVKWPQTVEIKKQIKKKVKKNLHQAKMFQNTLPIVRMWIPIKMCSHLGTNLAWIFGLSHNHIIKTTKYLIACKSQRGVLWYYKHKKN